MIRSSNYRVQQHQLIDIRSDFSGVWVTEPCSCMLWCKVQQPSITILTLIYTGLLNLRSLSRRYNRVQLIHANLVAVWLPNPISASVKAYSSPAWFSNSNMPLPDGGSWTGSEKKGCWSPVLYSGALIRFPSSWRPISASILTVHWLPNPIF